MIFCYNLHVKNSIGYAVLILTKQTPFESVFHVVFGKFGRYCGKFLLLKLYKIASAALNMSNPFLMDFDLASMYFLILENNTIALKICPCVDIVSSIELQLIVPISSIFLKQ